MIANSKLPPERLQLEWKISHNVAFDSLNSYNQKFEAETSAIISEKQFSMVCNFLISNIVEVTSVLLCA